MKLRSPLWPALVIGALILQILSPFRGWVILLVVLGGAWLIAYFWASSLKKGLRIEREIRYGWATVGDILEERFLLINASEFPTLWVEVCDHSTIPNYNVSRGTAVGWNSRNSWQTHQVCTRRGLFTLGPTTLTTGDPFGIYSVTINNPANSTILVSPPVLPLPDIEVSAGGQAGEGKPARVALEQTIASSGVRKYVTGDNLRWIHWRTSAKKQSWFVKTFDNTPTGDWWIILDLNEAVQAGTGATVTEEAGIILAASLADRGLQKGVRVGMAVNSNPPIWIPAASGNLQRLSILRALAPVGLGKQTAANTLEYLRGSLPQTASLILITPDVSGDWLKSLLPLMYRGTHPTVILLDPHSFGSDLLAQGLIPLLDSWRIPHTIFTADLLTQVEHYTHPRNRWQWRTLATGRVIPLQRPENDAWRKLS